ncbi:MAG: hypothetical protein AVDCRST_MAG73-752 [uncultured Thermomicrobiales bacterium]|uniref:Uncharacterized protein n=1 Tax=uncultured Thermomicrobiales bacterium TaxID=1645740 RepID=A0A6J4TQD3_9BACT|nr:MAG: hypothetical protein AVDCRST_MAG73-752 [uncultured Thermomicrobiales bacterium]
MIRSRVRGLGAAGAGAQLAPPVSPGAAPSPGMAVSAIGARPAAPGAARSARATTRPPSA